MGPINIWICWNFQRLFWAVLPEDADQEGSRATRRERWYHQCRLIGDPDDLIKVLSRRI
jgi:hypothetical protein